MEETVISIDNFVTGDKNNSQFFKGNNLFQFFFHDAVNPIDLDVDRIWHFACPASPTKYKIDPINTSRTSFIGTYNMLELAKKNNARILIASSSEIYGNPKVHPQPETYFGYVNPISKRSCYVEGKRFCESLALDYLRIHKTDIRIARIFNTYGPRMAQKDGRVISNFISQAICGKPMYIYGSGDQTRSFCYVDDLIQGLKKIMDSNYTLPINLGSQEELSILTLAKLIKKKINDKVDIVYMKQLEDDPIRRQPDTDLAVKLLKWKAKTPIEDGLEFTIKNFLND